MSFPKYKELEPVTTEAEIEKEIFLLQKTLLDLRMKKSTKQTIKPHLFLHAKRRIAQLRFKQTRVEKKSFVKENK